METTTTAIKLDPSWKNHLGDEFDKDYMVQLKSFLKTEYDSRKVIYPKGSEFFQALNTTPLEKVKVVILGQDPYHGPGQAHGLSFSVRPGVAIPPSLRNIYKEINQDLGLEPVSHGYLTPWAEQGVLLLNATLSVEAGKAGSHQKRGWESFTDRVIEILNESSSNVVFMLWGSYAQKKGLAIDSDRHLVLKAPHPSPLSAHRGWFGCGHFSKANTYLQSHGIEPVNWQLPSEISE